MWIRQRIRTPEQKQHRSDVATATLMLALALSVAAALFVSEFARTDIPKFADRADFTTARRMMPPDYDKSAARSALTTNGEKRRETRETTR